MADQKPITKIIASFVPDQVEDANQKTTDFKLALGGSTGLLLIVGAFLTLSGVFELVIERWNNFQISNATIMLVLGVGVVWFTLTKIGIKSEDKK
jgi:uncharacterized membrane protein YqjE